MLRLIKLKFGYKVPVFTLQDLTQSSTSPYARQLSNVTWT